jgi:hypothetical protein
MSFIVNMLAKISGASKVWAVLDGKKSYLAGAIGILSGVVGLLENVLAIVNAQDVSMLWDFLKALPTDQNILAIAAGLAAVGLRHAQEKNAPAA